MTVHYTVDGAPGDVRLDRPEVLNALDRPTLEAHPRRTSARPRPTIRSASSS